MSSTTLYKPLESNWHLEISIRDASYSLLMYVVETMFINYHMAS